MTATWSVDVLAGEGGWQQRQCKGEGDWQGKWKGAKTQNSKGMTAPLNLFAVKHDSMDVCQQLTRVCTM